MHLLQYTSYLIHVTVVGKNNLTLDSLSAMMERRENVYEG